MSFRSDLPFYSPTGIYPALTRRIVELATPGLVLKQLLIDLPLEQGASVDIPRESGSRTVYLQETPEGGEIVVDTTPYDKVTVTPVKYALADYVSRELLEDINPIVPIVDTKIRRLARRFAVTIESKIREALEAGAGETITASGKSLFYTGEEVTIAGTLGQYDIVDAIKTIKAKNLVPEFLLVSPAREADVEKLPHFSSALHYGEAVTMSGALGTIYGLTVLTSPIIPDDRAYVVSVGKNPSAAWEPLGFLVWKRPLSVETEYEKKTQRHIIYLSVRFSPVITSGANIVKITVGS
jgi:hypothetical protein